MTIFETYFLLFTDVLTSNFAFNTSQEIMFDVMKIFGEYDKRLIVIVSLSAYGIALCINFLLGRICYNILAPSEKQETNLPKLQSYVLDSKVLVVIIAFSAIPFFGKFIILFLGFCQIKFKRVFFIAILVKFIYYTVLSLNIFNAIISYF